MSRLRHMWNTASTILWGIALTIVSLPETIWHTARLFCAIIRDRYGIRKEYFRMIKTTARRRPDAILAGTGALVLVIALLVMKEWAAAVVVWLLAGLYNLHLSRVLIQDEEYVDMAMDFTEFSMAVLYPDDWSSRQVLRKRGLI